MDFPNISDCDYFKKGSITAGSNSSTVLIYKLKGKEDYTFIFKCPACGKENNYLSKLDIQKLKDPVDKKKKEYIVFRCEHCGQTYNLERFKVQGMKKGI